MRHTLSALGKAIEAMWRMQAPDPLNVLEYDFHLPRLTDAELEAIAQDWCRQYNRMPLKWTVVHDACHYLLDAPPTPVGEGVVTSFQIRHSIFDRTFFDAAVILAGRLAVRSKNKFFARAYRRGVDGLGDRVREIVARRTVLGTSVAKPDRMIEPEEKAAMRRAAEAGESIPAHEALKLLDELDAVENTFDTLVLERAKAVDRHQADLMRMELRVRRMTEGITRDGRK